MLYRDTKIDRSTVSQEIRQILGPEESAPRGSYREVQLVLPLDEPTLYVTTEPEADIRAGLNRVYKLPPFAPGAQITFRLRPGQSLYAATDTGIATIAIIVEYHQEGA